MAEETRAAGGGRAERKTRVGRVVSTKMTRTVTVAVDRRVPHPLYGKLVTRTKKLYAHDEREEAREGDIVRVAETRPLSKLKRWRLIEILERAK
jgi:small subunit ribosomal protein S17